MASRLATFLEAKEPLFDVALHQLEQRTGKKGIDAALAGEIAHHAGVVMGELGLADDCSGPELYAALTAKAREHDAHLARTLGGQDPEKVAEMIPLAIRRLEQIQMPRNCFALKYEKAAEMLAKRPPQALMQRLGYTDCAAMIAGEDLAELFIAIRFTEGPDWLNEFNTIYADLTGDDFEQRPIKLVRFDAHKWGDVAAHFIEKKKHINTHSKEMGVVAILPPTADRMPAITLKVMTLTLHYYNEVRLYSAYFKLLAHKPHFGRILSETLIADTPPIHLMAHGNVHWRVIQRYYGKIGEGDKHPEIFQPHLQPEDLHWRAAEKILYQIDPEMGMWRDLDYVAVLKGDDTVTFNLMDVVLSYANGVVYAERYLYHFRESLWNELFARYMGEKTLRDELLIKLDNAVVKPEELA
ncbi:MAG TPA: hypothetical protein VMR75_00760 [Candidatus Saccharimonadales bacterium]|nr:hypothetical protein [Candidatus Saccharimonadales bacterium]